jgi:hypothetical protein
MMQMRKQIGGIRASSAMRCRAISIPWDTCDMVSIMAHHDTVCHRVSAASASHPSWSDRFSSELSATDRRAAGSSTFKITGTGEAQGTQSN